METEQTVKMVRARAQSFLTHFGGGVFDKKAAAERRENEWILSSLRSAQREMDAAENRFNELTGPELLDAAAYQIMAEKSKYRYFMQQAKERNLLPMIVKERTDMVK